MRAPAHAHLHFRTAFHLVPREGAAIDAFSISIQKTREWVRGRLISSGSGTSATIDGAWFDSGGRYTSAGTGYDCQVRRLPPRVSQTAGESWALRLIHPCASVRSRMWQTDICIERRSAGAAGVSFLNYHWIGGQYVGPEPEAPSPSSPTLVRTLIDLRECEAFHGNVALKTAAIAITDEKLEAFRDNLLRRDRECPVVFVSCLEPDGEYLVAPERIAKSLAGNAIVCYPADLETSRAFCYGMPHELNSRSGMIRVYMPRVNQEDPFDTRRHRFFLPEEIRSNGTDAVVDVLAASLCRRYAQDQVTSALTVDDIDTLALRATLQARMEELTQREDVDWKAQYAADFDPICNRNLELEQEIAELRSQRDEREGQLQNENARLAFELATFKKQRQHAGHASLGNSGVAIVSVEKALGDFGLAVPKLDEALRFVGQCFPHRVIVCPEALSSAARAGINRKSTDLQQASRMLWHLATTVYDYFCGGVRYDGSLDDVILNATGFKLALTESGATKRDSDMLKARQRTVNGVEVDCVPHLKYGKDAATALRIHFGVLASGDARLLVIGHCGDHLDTAGTRRMS